MSKPTFPHAYLFKEVSPRTAARKYHGGLCKHWGCNNATRNETARDCSTCNSRKQRLRKPAQYAFQQVRESARKRNIPFNLTFAQFKEFDRQTGYVEAKGKSSESLTIDRINSDKGYEFGNIRALTWLENCSKKVEGMTDPAEPIARALCEAAGGDVWQRFSPQACSVLVLVECLQAQLEGGFEPPLGEDEEGGLSFLG